MHQETRTIEVGGERFEIAWNHRARSELKKQSGKDLHEIDPNDIDTAVMMIYAAIEGAAALHDRDAGITRRRLEALFNGPEDYAAAIETLGELIVASMPEPAKAGAKDPPKAARSRGRSRAATRSARSTSASPNASSGS